MHVRKPSAALLVALIALFVALGGSGYAALALPKNSVGTKQLKANSVNSAKVKPGSLLLSDIKASQRAGVQGSQGPAGPRGASGAPGAKGDPGVPATRLFAEISPGGSPAVLHRRRVTRVIFVAAFLEYAVFFDRDISTCAPLGTTNGRSDTRIDVSHSSDPTALFVRTFSGAPGQQDLSIPFTVAVFCG